MGEIFDTLASWAVTLGSGKDDQQLQKRYKMLCRELSSSNWNGFVILRCLGSFCLHAHCQFWEFQSFFGRFRTGQNLDLWNRVWLVLISAVVSFALFSFFCMTCLCAETAVICFAVMWRVVHALTVGCEWVFACWHRSALFHFCLRHRSVNDHTLPVKMWGTHLGVVVSVVSIGSVNHLLRCAAHTLGWEKNEFVFFLWMVGLWYLMALSVQIGV